MQPDGIIATYCIDMLRNEDEVLSLDLSWLKIETGPELVIRDGVSFSGKESVKER